MREWSPTFSVSLPTPVNAINTTLPSPMGHTPKLMIPHRRGWRFTSKVILGPQRLTLHSDPYDCLRQCFFKDFLDSLAVQVQNGTAISPGSHLISKQA